MERWVRRGGRWKREVVVGVLERKVLETKEERRVRREERRVRV